MKLIAKGFLLYLFIFYVIMKIYIITDAITDAETVQKGRKEMKIKVQYTTMIVKNLDESVKFYRDVLGFSEGYHVDTPDGGRITIMESEGGAAVV